jgi:hypothetical protein
MSLYDQNLAVTLTVAEWLEVQCALSDACTHNHGEFPMLTGAIRELKRKIYAQAGGAIDAASAQIAA